jgi:hypothetical protein
MKKMLCLSLAPWLSFAAIAGDTTAQTIRGDYLEVRSCDVYTGACVANSEMGLTGKEAMLVWSIKEGSWQGVTLDGLSIVAVVRADGTLGDLNAYPRTGRAVLIVDAKANSAQQEALKDFARSQGGNLTKEIAATKSAAIDVKFGSCTSGACATVKAGDLVEISTQCLGGKDHLCGNEENYYPPLTPAHHAFTAYTELAKFTGSDLNVTWSLTGKRSSYVGAFSR